MNCHFCNTVLYDTAPAGNLNEIFLVYVCPGCQPHEVIYRELYDDETRTLLSDAISIDGYHIIRNHHQNKTVFDKKGITFYEADGIWQLPSTDIDMILNKLRVYTTFI